MDDCLRGIDNATPTVGSGIEYVRRILEQGRTESATSDGVYVKAANGSLPLVVQAYNQVIGESLHRVDAILTICIG